MKACREYEELTRRGFITSAASSAVQHLLPKWMPRVTRGPMSSTRDVLVTVFMRGGADGLSLCVPHGDPDYYRLRPTIAVPQPGSSSSNRAKDLDGFFGLAPAMQPLLTPYKNGHLAFVHATGSTDGTRSHFDAMTFMEVGKPHDPTLFTGWVGRHLQTVSPAMAGSLVRGMSLTYGMARTLSGGPLSLALHDPGNYHLPGEGQNRQDIETFLKNLYSKYSDPLKTASLIAMDTADLLSTIDFANYKPDGGAVYPDEDFGHSLKAAAALIRAQVGIEAIHVDIDDWDTHTNQGVFEGHMFGRMKLLADSLSAFYTDMFAKGSPKLTLVAMSEFGRNVGQNAGEGTDHGHGNAMIVMGGAVNGNKVYRTWPGLHEDQQFEGQDLAITTDYRDVLAEIVAKRLENPTGLASVFPNYTPTYHDIVHA